MLKSKIHKQEFFINIKQIAPTLSLSLNLPITKILVANLIWIKCLCCRKRSRRVKFKTRPKIIYSSNEKREALRETMQIQICQHMRPTISKSKEIREFKSRKQSFLCQSIPTFSFKSKDSSNSCFLKQLRVRRQNLKKVTLLKRRNFQQL